ncbi:MAG: pitrilysin family protein, partial [Anaerolineae bacterium]
HFIEHMVFKGTANWPTARDIAEAIEGKGGVFNASTGLESTLYWAKVAAAHLPEALGVLSDMLLRATFDPMEIEKERAVIGEEINYSLDAPDSLAQILANALQWPNHPLGRDVAGTRETVASISRETLLDYRLDHYRPNTAILGLAGKITHAQALELAHKYLAGWEPGRTMDWEPAPPNGAGPNLHVGSKQTEQAHLVLSFAGLSRDDPDRFAARLLNVILGEGMRSRLFQKVREELGLAYSVDAYTSTLQDTGAMGIYAGVATARSEEAVRAILDQLDQLRQEPVPEDELARAKEFIRGRLALSLEDSFAVATWYARQELLAAEVLEPRQVIEQLEAVQAQDVQRLARAVFRQEHLNLAAVGPFAENGERFQQAIRF